MVQREKGPNLSTYPASRGMYHTYPSFERRLVDCQGIRKGRVAVPGARRALNWTPANSTAPQFQKQSSFRTQSRKSGELHCFYKTNACRLYAPSCLSKFLSTRTRKGTDLLDSRL